MTNEGREVRTARHVCLFDGTCSVPSWVADATSMGVAAKEKKLIRDRKITRSVCLVLCLFHWRATEKCQLVEMFVLLLVSLNMLLISCRLKSRKFSKTVFIFLACILSVLLVAHEHSTVTVLGRPNNNSKNTSNVTAASFGLRKSSGPQQRSVLAVPFRDLFQFRASTNTAQCASWTVFYYLLCQQLLRQRRGFENASSLIKNRGDSVDEKRMKLSKVRDAAVICTVLSSKQR